MIATGPAPRADRPRRLLAVRLCLPEGHGRGDQGAGHRRLSRRCRAAAPFLGDGLGELQDWDEVKLLTVALDRLTRWHRPGLLAIGDAAHAMSPIGGVGINLAIQDAVAAANILAGPSPVRNSAMEVVAVTRTGMAGSAAAARASRPRPAAPSAMAPPPRPAAARPVSARPVRQPLEQPAAERPFQGCHLTADGGLADPEATRARLSPPASATARNTRTWSQSKRLSRRAGPPPGRGRAA